MGVLVITMKNNGELKRKIISLIFTLIILIIGICKNEIFINNNKITNTSNVIAAQTINKYSLEEDVVNFINDNKDIFNFYSNTFGISINNIKESIIIDNMDTKFNRNDIGNTHNNYDSLDKNLIDYLFKLKKSNKKLFKQEYTNSNIYSREYIYGLINYFSSIYTNVDYDVLASIAYIESGNLNSKYMRKCNNIYGGMSSHGLIKYNNIEFGVLSYVKMMAKSYYAKGLTTVETIARKYNPGSTTWVGNINKTRNKFKNIEKIDINTLINLK